MEIVKTFGNYIEKWCETSPERARWLLKTGWEAQNLKFRFLPEGQLNPSDQYPGRHDDERYDTAAEASRKFGYGKCIYSVRTASGGRSVPYNVESFSCISCGITGRETFSSGSRGFWNFRNTLQLSQDIYRSCRKGPSSETEMYRLYEPGV